MTARPSWSAVCWPDSSPASPPSSSPTRSASRTSTAPSRSRRPGRQRAEAHTHAEEAGRRTAEEDEGTVVSRDNQRTWGLLPAPSPSASPSAAWSRSSPRPSSAGSGRLTPGQSTALVAAVGFVAVALVPFLKYPATPPAVGNADTIGDRTG